MERSQPHLPEERQARRSGAVRGFLGRGGQAPGAEAVPAQVLSHHE